MKKNKIVFGFNAKNGAIFGFYAYLLVSAIYYFYYLFTGDALFPLGLVFLSGLLVFFVAEFVTSIMRINQKRLNK